MIDYRFTGWRQVDDKLIPLQVLFKGKKIGSSTDVEELYKEGNNLLAEMLPVKGFRSILDVMLWKQNAFGIYMPQTLHD